jgi:hypothetical protein
MPTPSANQGIPEQQGADPANLPNAQVSWDGVMENRLFQRYTNEADRTARNPAPNENESSALAAEDRVDIFNSVNWVSLYGRSLFAFKRKAADSAAVNNSTVLVNDTDLVVAVPAAGVFAWRQVSFYSCTAVADFKCTYTFPAGVTNIKWGITGLSGAAAANPGDGAFNVVTASATTISVGGDGVGNLLRLSIEGEVTMGGTAGNIQFQYAQQNAEATNLIHRQASRLEMWRVS